MSKIGQLFSNDVVQGVDMPGLTPYAACEARMQFVAGEIAAARAEQQLWFLEHPSLYTAGTSAKETDLLKPRFPVHETGRGGQYTYHGPGQRTIYVMLDLRGRGRDVRCFVSGLEQLIINIMDEFNITAYRAHGRVGVWTRLTNGREAKIAAIGLRIRRWVSFHGIAINVDPDLSHFGGIVPCGLPGFDVTSMRALGVDASMADVDAAAAFHFGKIFGPLNPND